MSQEKLLQALQTCWESSGDTSAKQYADLLKAALEDDNKQPAAAGDASIGVPSEVALNDSIDDDVKTAIKTVWGNLPWAKPTYMGDDSNLEAMFDGGEVKVAELLTGSLTIRLIHMSPGTFLPQHAKNAGELLQILSGKTAKIGPIKEWLKPIDNTNFFSFPATAPQTIQAGEEPLLLASAWSLAEKEAGQPRFWFSDVSKGAVYTKDIMEIQNVEDYYNTMAADYEGAMLGWGYCMPEIIAQALIKHGGLDSKAKVLDLGCGNGLSGQALFDRGITDLTGLDFSSEMIKQSTKRAVYTTLQKADLLKPLPFEDNLFDCLLSVAVTTYLNPSVLELWIRVAKPGGLVAFTHKTSVWEEWEKEQDRLEKEAGVWEKVWVSDPPIPYLPSLKEKGGEEPCKEMAKVYIYRVK